MKCLLCDRDGQSERGYCKYHSKAYSNLLSAYPIWERAYERLTWGGYLQRIASLSETGTWVKEVAESELRKMDE